MDCKLITFNCKSVKRSATCIRQLCDSADIIALQETWLLPHDISFLGTIHENYEYTGKSAVDTSKELLRGRPYGGVAILWRKNVFNSIKIIECASARISAVRFEIENRFFIVFSVYMPTQCLDNLPEFTECLSEINAIVESSELESIYILGDFNAHPTELFSNELNNFCADQSWCCADVIKLGIDSNEYTFVSDAHGSRRWLDHCVVTQSAWETVRDIKVCYDVMWSDHFPLSMCCDLNLVLKKVVPINEKNVSSQVIWGDRQLSQINIYSEFCNDNLKLINFPNEFVVCADKCCNDISHRSIIDKLYHNIIKILREGAILTCKYNNNNMKGKSVPGWNKHVSTAHKQARLKLNLWFLYGKPSSGVVYDDMCESRKIFKAKLRWCQTNQEQIKMDIIASHKEGKNFSKFWKSIKKLDSKPGLPASVAAVSEPELIANMFKDHFSVRSPLGQSGVPLMVGDKTVRSSEKMVRVTAKEVRKVIRTMTSGKSPGHDGLSVEHLRYAGVHLPGVLAMFYSLCINHMYLPLDCMKTIVVPVVKNRTGDIADINNYRPISLATIVAKVLDRILDKHLDQHLQLHDGQFGFRPGLSTESAILSLKYTVQYYVDRKTPVYACFLDLSKAFDRVCYDILWEKLRDTNLPEELCSVFEYWYSHQINHVKWAGALSDAYGMECGVRQGGVTSPRLFNLYVDNLIDGLSSLPVGCTIDGVSVNNLSYADDMVLLAPSIRALRILIAFCEAYAASHGLEYNATKCEFIVFGPGGKSPALVPPIILNGNVLRRVKTFRYLGHLVTENLRDEEDIERERRALTVRANMLVRRFARCSKEVKISLFKSFCQTFYTSSLWTAYTQKSVGTLRVQYNNAFRMLLGLPRFCSASGMFAEARTDGFAACMRKKVASLLRRTRGSTNTILKTIADKWDGPLFRRCIGVLLK